MVFRVTFEESRAFYSLFQMRNLKRQMAWGAFLMLMLNKWKGLLRFDFHLSLWRPVSSWRFRDCFPSGLDRLIHSLLDNILACCIVWLNSFIAGFAAPRVTRDWHLPFLTLRGLGRLLWKTGNYAFPIRPTQGCQKSEAWKSLAWARWGWITEHLARVRPHGFHTSSVFTF